MLSRILCSIICFLNLPSLAADDSSGPLQEELSTQHLKGVLLVSNQSEFEPGGIDIEGFESKCLDVPSGLSGLSHRLGPCFLGKPITDSLLKELKREVIHFYRDHGFPVVLVQIPAQTVANGCVQLIVTEGVLGDIYVCGNRYFSSQMLGDYIRIDNGEPINSRILLSDVAWINTNPFRHADLLFTPGEERNTTDIELIIEDRRPIQVYVGVDNTGIVSTGSNRWFTGFRWGNAFWVDHTLSYQFTTASSYHKFWAHTLMYNAPLPWRHFIFLYGGYAEIHPDISDFKTHGHNTQASIRYQMPLVPFYNSFIQEPSFGFDYKNLNSNLFFEAPNEFLPVVTHAVNIAQFYAGYSIGRNWEKNRVTFRIEGFWSPGAMMPNQKNSNFSALHPGAKNQYFYSRLQFSDTWTLPYKFMLMGQFRGQISTQNLVPSEQFGLGGYNTVRGYEEQEWNYDDAICINLEAYLPSFSLSWKKKWSDELRLLGFFDFGTGRNVHSEGVPQWQHLMSVGPGLRYKFKDYFSARLDWGFRLHTTTFNGYGSKLHFGLMGSF